MTGLSQEEFGAVAKEIQEAWTKAQTRDDALRVIVNYGQKHGYKNVMAAIQNRTPKRFSREQPLSEWVEKQRSDEDTG